MTIQPAPRFDPEPEFDGPGLAEEIFARFLGPKTDATAGKARARIIEEPPVPPAPREQPKARRRVLGFVTARKGEGLSTLAHHALVEGDPAERSQCFAQAQAVVDLRLARGDSPGVWLRGGPADLTAAARFLRALLLTWKVPPARIAELVDEEAAVEPGELVVHSEAERAGAFQRAVRVVLAARLARRAVRATERVQDLVRNAAEWRTLQFLGSSTEASPPFDQVSEALNDAWGSLFADLYELGALMRELDVGLALRGEAGDPPPAAAPKPLASNAESDDWSVACKAWAQEIVSSQPSPGAKWTNQSLAAHIIAQWDARPFEAQPPLRRDADQPGPPSAGSLQKRISAWRNEAEDPLVFPGA